MNIKLILIGLLLVLFSTQAFALNDASLVAYYNFDETSGTTIIDRVNFDKNLVLGNSTLNQTGLIGKAIIPPNYGNNVPTYYNSTGADFRFIESFSVNQWIKNNGINNNELTSNFSRDTGNKYKGWWTVFVNTNKFSARIANGGTGMACQTDASTSFPDDGEFHMVTAVYNRVSKRLLVYIDGVLDGNTNCDTTPTYSTFSKFSPSGWQFDALNQWQSGGLHTQDELGIWNRALSQTEINELYNSGAGITYPFSSASFTYNINKSEAKIYLTDTSNFTVITDWNWLVDGLSISTDQNTSFAVVSNTDYNVCLIINSGEDSHCSTINSGELFGQGFLKMYDSLNNELDEVGYSIDPVLNGVSSGVLTDNNLDLNLQAIISQNYTFTFTKSDYTTLSFTLPLTQYTDLNYSFVLIDSNKSTNVNFQVFDLSGAYANTKTFFAYDYSLDKYVGIQTTDTLGRLSFNLDQRKSDYNFFSTDFNFGTTVWTINKPKDALTLLDINGNWDYSITGASYSSASNIVAGIQKLLLQNTVYPYTIKITDTNKNYIPTTFGLKSVTSEKTKTLTPYLYKRGDADLKLIKLIDFSTNQPHSNPEELKLNLYNDINGLIPIGVFVNDSTGTYNIFMDKNATYELQVLSQSYTLRPTLDIYYLYLTQDINILIDNDLIVDVNVPVMDSNLPIIFMQVREVAFGCTMGQENCYPSMIFSLIVISLLLIVLAISGQVSAISQSISTGILLTIFLIIGFIPLWLFGVGVVILIAWGVFGQ